MVLSEHTLGALALLGSTARDIALREMRTVRFTTNQQVFAPGDNCSNYLIVKSGSVRVFVTTDAGRDILLYRVESGETCVLTLSCLMSGIEYDAEGVAETETEAYILPKKIFDELIATSPEFRQYVFSSFGIRIHGLIGLVQEIAVKQVDRRLARLLLQSSSDEYVTMTHQAIAQELGSVREVVTRLLNDFSEKGWVGLERGRIHIKQASALEKLVPSH